MLKDCTSINYFQYNFKYGIIGLYCVVLKQNIYCSTTWSIKKKLFESEENKYRCSFEWMQYKDVYVRPCLVTPIGSNTKRSNVKPCAWCIVWL
jgi:hypothetical protein